MNKENFNCKCGKCNLTFSDMAPSFIKKLAAAEKMSYIDFNITSGMRCDEYNKIVGGSKASSHIKGYAGDIEIKNSYERFRIAYSLLMAGIKRIGIGSDFIHADDDPEKVDNVMWIY